MGTADRIYRISVNLPPEFLDEMMDEIESSVPPLYPKYTRAFNHWPVTGTWRPSEGSDPYKGTVGRIEVSEEVRLEFAVREEDLETAFKTIMRVHPYEEPAIDAVPILPWRSVIPASDDR